MESRDTVERKWPHRFPGAACPRQLPPGPEAYVVTCFNFNLEPADLRLALRRCLAASFLSSLDVLRSSISDGALGAMLVLMVWWFGASISGRLSHLCDGAWATITHFAAGSTASCEAASGGIVALSRTTSSAFFADFQKTLARRSKCWAPFGRFPPSRGYARTSEGFTPARFSHQRLFHVMRVWQRALRRSREMPSTPTPQAGRP